MTKREWESKLRDAYNSTLLEGERRRAIRLPEKIIFGGDGNNLEMFLPPESVEENMQNDCACFEGWVLSFIIYLNVKKIVFDWSVPKNPRALHYQRFLYRVKRFTEYFGDYLKIKNSNALSQLLIEQEGNTYILNEAQNRNCPNNLDPTIALNSKESALEQTISCNEIIKNRLMKISGTTYLNYQLPVGVFKNKVAKENMIFNGGRSAIDIWGTGGDCLHIFELKNSDNKKVGAISELLFYTFVMRDLQKGVFQYDDFAGDVDPSKMKTLKSYILAPEFHPLVIGKKAKIIKLINKRFAEANEPITINMIKIRRTIDFECHNIGS